MKVKDCAVESSRSEGTVRRWLDEGKIPFEKDGLSGAIFIDLVEWEKFCKDNNIQRRGE